MKIALSGYSDDNICIGGDYQDSVGAYNGSYLLFADGSVIHGEYDIQGIWRFRVERAGAAVIKHEPFTGTRDDDDDSDAWDLMELEAPDLSLVWSGSAMPPDAPMEDTIRAAKIVNALRGPYSLDDRALTIAVRVLSPARRER